jgi:hypothetical protein
MGAQLVIIHGPDRGMIIPLTEGKQVQIGRGQQPDVGLKDLYVSRVHCSVMLKGDRLVVTDLGSAAGTYVNNQPVTSRTIRDGEYLQIGETHLSLRLAGQSLLDQATIAPPLAAPAMPVDRMAPTEIKVPPILLSDDPGPPPPPAPAPKRPAKGGKAFPLPAARLGELTGETLAHYEIGPMLGRGQTGLVFRAFDVRKKKTLALKVLWPGYAHDDAEIRRFIRSMKTALPLRHPNLVTVYGAGKKGAYCYIAMKYIQGESLTEMIRRVGSAGKVEWRAALPIGVQLARALTFAHGAKTIHRNLTPQNVLIRSADKRTFLSDLFLAKAMEGGLAAQLTRPGEVLGDIRYMAPERLEGMSRVDHRSDLYSLGALLYTMLAGKPPFEGASLPELIVKLQTEEPEGTKQFQPTLPNEFDALVKKLLAKPPEDRYQETANLLADLESLAISVGVEV